MREEQLLQSPIPPEELARARIYRLLARLVCAPPDAALLDAIGEAEDVDADTGDLVDPWLSLARAARLCDAEAVRREHARLLAGKHGTGCLETLCLTMARAIDVHGLGLAAQRRYFFRAVPQARRRFAALGRGRGFYRHVGLFATAFFRIERAAFHLPTTNTGVAHEATSQAPVQP